MQKLHFVSCALLLAAIHFHSSPGMTVTASAQDPEVVAALPEKTLPALPTRTLPARDCLNCPGPPAHAPCFHTHRGFLYYGTYPWDDDPVNGFDDCPHGQCGYPGAALSLAWIRWHQNKHHRAQHHHHQDAGRDCPSCRGASFTVPPVESQIDLLHTGGLQR